MILHGSEIWRRTTSLIVRVVIFHFVLDLFVLHLQAFALNLEPIEKVDCICCGLSRVVAHKTKAFASSRVPFSHDSHTQNVTVRLEEF